MEEELEATDLEEGEEEREGEKRRPQLERGDLHLSTDLELVRSDTKPG